MGYRPDADDLLNNIFTQLASTQASEMDGKLSDALRNILFGADRQEDLCARNIFRGRELAMPTYAGIANCFGTTADATVCSLRSLPLTAACCRATILPCIHHLADCLWSTVVYCSSQSLVFLLCCVGRFAVLLLCLTYCTSGFGIPFLPGC